MFSYNILPDPNLDHTVFFILMAGISVITLGYLYKYIGNNYKPPYIFLTIIWGFGIIVYNISYSDFEIPENKEYRAKFIQFVAEREKHQGVKGQTSYSNYVYCEYELDINKQKVLMPCNSKQSPEYVILYWNKK